MSHLGAHLGLGLGGSAGLYEEWMVPQQDLRPRIIHISLNPQEDPDIPVEQVHVGPRRSEDIGGPSRPKYS